MSNEVTLCRINEHRIAIAWDNGVGSTFTLRRGREVTLFLPLIPSLSSLRSRPCVPFLLMASASERKKIFGTTDARWSVLEHFGHKFQHYQPGFMPIISCFLT